ncbi:hypothetical protein [Rhizobium sp. BK060]|uniref:hypothetical protein n=1 Tax=Rhizobium sp. BK060 TaxID=2587096 RepID=UPI001807B1D9|nr:hypothetical protein [Rhizobium sp. BK060]MBB3395013.1 hypothetical protein [Rhizobium sp. BK060]
MIGFVGSNGDALELLEPTEDVFDEMPPFVEFAIGRQRSCASWAREMATSIEIGDDVRFTATM